MYTKWTRLVLATIGTLILIDVQVCFAVIEGDIELLKIVADGYEANLVKLKTWAGEANIVSSVSHKTGQGSIPRQEKYRAEFLINQELDAVRWKWFCLEEFDPKTSQWHRSARCPMSGLSKGDCDYVLFFLGHSVKDAQRSLNIYRKDGWPDHFEGIGFDPLHIMTKEIYPDVVGQLRGYYRLGATMKSKGIIKRQEDIVILQTGGNYEGYGKIVTRFEFDLSKGCCLKEYVTSSAANQTRWELDYEKIADVFVLKSVSHIRKDQHTTSERKAILTSKMVNSPAGKAEFLLGTLGLRPGDKIHDTRTNLMYIFGEKGATEADMPPTIVSSLINKRLPDFDSIKINLTVDQVKDKMILVCFFDMNQRPSRHCLTQLAKRSEQLKEKGVTIVVVHTLNLDEQIIREWVERNNVPFSVGMMKDEEKRAHFTWGVKSLPWLILTDTDQIVRAEGFGMDELDDKICEAQNTQ